MSSPYAVCANQSINTAKKSIHDTVRIYVASPRQYLSLSLSNVRINWLGVFYALFRAFVQDQILLDSKISSGRMDKDFPCVLRLTVDSRRSCPPYPPCEWIMLISPIGLKLIRNRFAIVNISLCFLNMPVR